MKTKKIAVCAIFTALALGLSYVERFIPINLVIQLPGVKLGLANIVTLLAIYFLGNQYAAGILVARCTLGSLFGGGLTALAFSLTGGLLALAVMLAARRIKGISIFGVSVLGAAAHNIGQIAAASAVLGSLYVVAYLPFLLIVSVVTGMLTGAIASASFTALVATGQAPIVPAKRK